MVESVDFLKQNNGLHLKFGQVFFKLFVVWGYCGGGVGLKFSDDVSEFSVLLGQDQKSLLDLWWGFVFGDGLDSGRSGLPLENFSVESFIFLRQ